MKLTTNDDTVVRHIKKHNSISANADITTNFHIANYFCSRTNVAAIPNFRSAKPLRVAKRIGAYSDLLKNDTINSKTRTTGNKNTLDSMWKTRLSCESRIPGN